MYAICEFRIPVKLNIAGRGIDSSALGDITKSIVSYIKFGQAELISVDQYYGQAGLRKDRLENTLPAECTYFEVSIDLDSHQRRDWKTYEDLIKGKVVEELESEDLYISALWHRGCEEHVGFVKDYNNN